MKKIVWEIANLTKIGNSYGLIINRKMLNHLGIINSKKISVSFRDQSIVLENADKIVPVNLDLSTWDKQFEKAFKENRKPEKSVWPDEMSLKSDNEWTW